MGMIVVKYFIYGVYCSMLFWNVVNGDNGCYLKIVRYGDCLFDVFLI